VSPSDARRILVATDFSAASATAERVAREYAQRLQASVHVLHVVETGEEIVNALLGDVARGFEPILPTVVIERGDPAARIADYARCHGIDLIVVGTHGRTGVTRALLGSVAERLLRNAPCPVLAVPASLGEGGIAPPTGEGAATSAPPDRCVVCRKRSPDLICTGCRARIRGEALERKQHEARAGWAS
jgi:nucleotide-binding universal stress UspA family protein